jgi:hypothetical protein
MEAIKPAFLDTANHYAQLGKHNEQFAAFLTFAALDPGDTFTKEELATAICALPADGLRKSTQTLVQALESAGDQREDYWKNHVLPFWEEIWPKSNDLASSADADSLACLCIAAGGEFPSALKTVEDWLRVVQHYGCSLSSWISSSRRFCCCPNHCANALTPSVKQRRICVKILNS